MLNTSKYGGILIEMLMSWKSGRREKEGVDEAIEIEQVSFAASLKVTRNRQQVKEI